MRIYLDVCCFNRPFDDQSQLRIKLEAEAKLDIQQKIRKGELELAWSYALDYENAANPFEERKISIMAWKDLASVDVTETEAILAQATAFKEAGLKNIDALHLACAIEMGCQYFFTTDDGILKKRDGVEPVAILNPVDYITGNYHDD
jgi:predicted nucleic acid-binding protein